MFLRSSRTSVDALPPSIEKAIQRVNNHRGHLVQTQATRGHQGHLNHLTEGSKGRNLEPQTVIDQNGDVHTFEEHQRLHNLGLVGGSHGPLARNLEPQTKIDENESSSAGTIVDDNGDVHTVQQHQEILQTRSLYILMLTY